MFTARKMGKVFFTNSGSEANDSQVFGQHYISSHLQLYCNNQAVALVAKAGTYFFHYLKNQ
jgi:adenosylmethionine-8-amino-7-oxononanoate aminotransferase